MRSLVLVLAGSLLGGLARADGAAPPAPAPTARATIGVVAKTHGVTLADGRQGVRLDVPIDTVGMKGRTLACAIFFQDAAGQPIRSTEPAYAASDGQLRVVSRDVTVAADPESLKGTLEVPYGAFPNRPGDGYAVVGHVRVFERTPAGRTLFASALVQFWVGR